MKAFAQTKVIDIHSHWGEREDEHHTIPEFLERLYEIADRNNVAKICISDPYHNGEGNERVKKLLDLDKRGLLIGFAFLRLGIDGEQQLREAYSEGFRGMKVVWPIEDYSHPDYYPLYREAAELGMPILFHTGSVREIPRWYLIERYGTTAISDHIREDVSGKMRPIHIGEIAARFPTLKLIGAHLGVEHTGEAVEQILSHENVYFDITGDEEIQRNAMEILAFYKGSSEYARLSSRLLYGTDATSLGENGTKYSVIERLFDEYGIDDRTRKMLLFENSAGLLGLEKISKEVEGYGSGS
ncbi:hypothetical protein A3K63_02610 [Candidatus Micrarchaeota archaeon RBG_16_49_10]|nr:MAG: hypothetical protein A3K63_02610 [Candidatus Micrarchaeota archaeon RBG_16_49_10]